MPVRGSDYGCLVQSTAPADAKEFRSLQASGGGTKCNYVSRRTALLLGPAWSPDDMGDALRPSIGPRHVPRHSHVLVGGDPCGIERVDVGGQAIDNRLLLAGEGPKQPVPDDENATVVPVEVLTVGAVVDTVVRRGVHHLLCTTDPIIGLGVVP
jgi:hypothetical protein